ncbi:MAG TPA: glycosyltransferase [Bryobacteraceae bacterium]|nr:glycosyltransferase [Bryobacteraceae bacterium]
MNLKILIIVENESVPFDSRVWKEAQSLFAAGYQVSVICPKRKGYTQSHEVLQGVHIYRHPAPPEMDGPFGYLVEFSFALFWEFLFSWWIFFTRGFHVIQGCNPPDDIFWVALPFKLFGVKYIFDHHDANPELYEAKFERRDLFYKAQVLLEKLTYRFSDVVIATNLSYRKLAIDRGGLPADRVFVVRNGPDLDTFKPVPPIPDLKYGKKYLVGYVGTMGNQDGLDILIDVALHIKNSGRSDVHFTCVGSGPALAELRELVQRKDLSGIMNFTGRIPDKDLLEILSTADVCVNPDRPCEMNNISTMIKIMEYMALGKPIVQFDLAEGKFSAQRASLYADPGKPVEDFAAKILWLLDRPEARQAMGAEGHRRVAQELAWGHSVPHLLAAYERALAPAAQPTTRKKVNHLYNWLRPFLPLSLRLLVRRWDARNRRRTYQSVWPIDQSSAAAPDFWPGWPEGKRFALVLTHDVEGQRGLDKIAALMSLEAKHGFRSSFNLVPEGDYQVPDALRHTLESSGFEVGLHGLQHDGRLYSSRAEFMRKAARIREYAKLWNVSGFRSPLMQHRLDWLHELGMEYDCSTFDTDPFEPQPDGVHTIFPFRVSRPDGSEYIELPYTLPQDHTLFVIFRERDISTWKKKLDWVAEQGGMVLLNTHPDYMNFEGRAAADEYPVSYYEDLLRYLRDKYAGEFWHATPREVARFCRSYHPCSSVSIPG